MTQTQSEKITNKCDQIMFWAMCALIYFLPISTALVEWSFGFAFIAYVVKRSVQYKFALKERGGKVDNRTKVQFLMQAFKPVDHFLLKPLTFFIGITLLSVVFGYYPIESFNSFFTKFLQSVFTCLLFVEAVNSRRKIKIFLNIFLISITLVFINGLFQYFTGEGFLRHRELFDGRVSSSFHHANDFGAYLVTILPILISLSVLQYFKQRKSDSLNKTDCGEYSFFVKPKFVIGVFIIFILCVLNLGLSYSRGAWLASAIAIIFLFRKNPKFLTVYMLVVVVFLAIFIPKMVNERKINISGSYLNAISSVSSRNSNWKDAVEIIKDYPVLGVGLNNYTNITKIYNFKRQEYAHNSYLQLTAENGLLGLFSFLWILWTLLKESAVRLRQLHGFAFHLLLGVQIGFLGFLIHSFVDTNFYATQLSSLMWLMMGFLVAIIQVEFKDAQPTQQIG